MKPILRVIVTGGAGQVAYSLLFRIAEGDLFGLDQPIALHLHDLPEMQKSLEGVAMELNDCAFPLLHEIRFSSDHSLFKGVHFAILLGAHPRTVGMERKDLLLDNAKIFFEQGKILNDIADPDVRVLVVGNPCNTNCLILLHNAPKIPRSRFFALTRLDQNRATYQLASFAKKTTGSVSRMTIWGNHSSTQVVDFFNAKIDGKQAVDMIQNKEWLQKEFTSKVQKRGSEVLNLRGKSSAASAAKASMDALRSILNPTKNNDWYSMGIYSKKNPYGIDENLVFSFPCRTNLEKEVEIVSNLNLNPYLREKLAVTQNELIEERTLVKQFLK